MIYILKNEYEKIIEQAKGEFPLECCGFLAGMKEEENIFIREAFPLKNIDASSEHFSMDAKEQFDTIREIRGKGMILIGNYHSHPYTPSRPSEEDKRLAFDPNAVYGIISLEKEEPVFKLFEIRKGDVKILEYEIM
jgi:proteasome lid subunit RPN8/RPN11